MSRAMIIGEASRMTPDWYERMEGFLSPWCSAEDAEVPEAHRLWGCYRMAGHTGRHLGIVTKQEHDDGSRFTDYWAVWP